MTQTHLLSVKIKRLIFSVHVPSNSPCTRWKYGTRIQILQTKHHMATQKSQTCILRYQLPHHKCASKEARNPGIIIVSGVVKNEFYENRDRISLTEDSSKFRYQAPNISMTTNFHFNFHPDHQLRVLVWVHWIVKCHRIRISGLF